MLKKTTLALAMSTLLLAACDKGTDPAFVFYVTDGVSIFVVNGSNPIDTEGHTLVGLNDGTQLYAIDVNPKTGKLNGLGSDGQSYLIEPDAGIARAVGAPDTTTALANRGVEMDYNPTVATQTVYRVATSTGDNFRRNDSTGARSGTDSAFVYKTGDVNAGKSVVISGLAYTNSQFNGKNTPTTGTYTGPAVTTVYAIDNQNDTLAILGGKDPSATERAAACPNATNPNCGQLTTVGKLGLDVTGFVGFDVLGANTAYAVAFGNKTYNLYSVDLATGQLSFVSALNPKITLPRALAVAQM